MRLVVLLAVLVLAAAAVWAVRGILRRWSDARTLRRRERREDALKHILKSELSGRAASATSVAGALRVSEDAAAGVLGGLEQDGLLRFEAGAPRLRAAGREQARRIIRAHRVWESFLADQTGVAETEWHRQAERQEHLLSTAETDRLAARLGNPLRDPHGDAIPATDEEVPTEADTSLTELAVGEHFEIVHLEDEPEVVYRQLCQSGLKTGLVARVAGRSGDQIELTLPGGARATLSTLQATNVSVVVRAPGVAMEARTLRDLDVGETAFVHGLAPACRGAARRRLLDLGFVPGTPVGVDMISPAGDPVAYQVRGAVVALRRSQAEMIQIRRTAEGAP